MKRFQIHRPDGFTLTEIIIALAVIAVLSGALVPQVIKHLERAKSQSVVDDFLAIEAAMMDYYADVSTLKPLDDISGFSTTRSAPTAKHFLLGDGQAGWDGPYIKRIKTSSAYGATWDIDVFTDTSATIDLGEKSDLGTKWDVVLNMVNEKLDGDGDTTQGVVWGDDNGIHYGINYVK